MRRLVFLVIMCIRFSMVSASNASIIAFVNNDLITLSEFENRKQLIISLNEIKLDDLSLEKQLNQFVLNSLIDDILLYQNSKFIPSENEISEAIAALEKHNKLSSGYFVEKLLSQGIDINTFKFQIGAEIIKMHILSNFSSSSYVLPEEIDVEFLKQDKSNAKISALYFISKDSKSLSLRKMYNLQKKILDCRGIKKGLYDHFATLKYVDTTLNDLDLFSRTIVRDLMQDSKSSIFKYDDRFAFIVLCEKKLYLSEDNNNIIFNFLMNKKLSKKMYEFLETIRNKSYIKILAPQ